MIVDSKQSVSAYKITQNGSRHSSIATIAEGLDKGVGCWNSAEQADDCRVYKRYKLSRTCSNVNISRDRD